MMFASIHPDGNGMRRLECRITCPDLHHADEIMVERHGARPCPRENDLTDAVNAYREHHPSKSTPATTPTRVWSNLIYGYPKPCPLCGLDADVDEHDSLSCPRHGWMRAGSPEAWDALVDTMLRLHDPCPYCRHPIFPSVQTDGRVRVSCDCATGVGLNVRLAELDYRDERSRETARRTQENMRRRENLPMVKELRAWIDGKDGH